MAEQVHKPGILWHFHTPVNSLTTTVETWSVTQDTQYICGSLSLNQSTLYLAFDSSKILWDS